MTKGHEMTSQQTASPATGVSRSGRPGSALILGAVGFVLLYLISDLVVPNLASSAMPLPNAAVEQTRAWFADNQLAAVMIAACQFLSVACLAVFVTQFGRSAAGSGDAESVARATPWGTAAVTMMMLASVLAWLLAALAPEATLGVVSTLRTANFVTGGAAHVLTLGVFVLLASRLAGVSRPVRVLGYVAAVPCVLSILSFVWWQAAALILLGRLLCMAWTISAAVSLTRRQSET